VAKGYVIGQVDIKDPDAYARYRAKTPASVAEFGGRFLVRGGAVEALEGDPPLPRIVVLEFPSFEQAKAWYSSPGYQAIIGIRQGASVGRLFLVEGAD
jgi:uncharacterized protein (DUF1330 family)